MPHALRLICVLALTPLFSGCLGGESSDDVSNTSGNNCQDLDIAQQEMLQEINAARAVARTCGTGADSKNFAATTALSWNNKLYQAAQGHSQDMAQENFFSHTGSDGLTLVNRVNAVNYNYSTVGENIAAGYNTTKAVVAGWLKSEGHCKNIMNPAFTEIGSSCLTADNADYKTYWTQVLGKPQ